MVVNLGDTFDTHAVVRSEIMTEFVRHVKEVTKTSEYVYLLGNHDMFKPSDAKYHALGHLKGAIDRFTIIDEITDLYGITWVPYQHNPANFPTNTHKLCIAHQTFKNADYGDITVKDGVDSDTVNAEMIISGHIHKRQFLGKVIYPGSPMSQSSSDINQVKGVMLYDTDTMAYRFIDAPMPMWRGARFEISPSLSVVQIGEELGELLHSTRDHWIIEIAGPKAEITSFLDSKKTKKLFEGKDVKVKSVFVDKEKKLAAIKSVSIEGIVNEYIDKVYSGSLDKQQLQLKSMELLEKISKSKRSDPTLV